MSPRILVAGVGNIFCGDDGFGSTVAQRLATESLPPGVELRDYGIRGVHLAYQLLDGYDVLVLIDAVERGGPPGTVYVVEPELEAAPRPGEPGHAPELMVDAHDMAPDAVLAMVPILGGTLGNVLLVGCEPEQLAPGMGLSPAVERAVEEAAWLVMEIVRTAATTAPAGQPEVVATETGGT